MIWRDRLMVANMALNRHEVAATIGLLSIRQRPPPAKSRQPQASCRCRYCHAACAGIEQPRHLINQPHRPHEERGETVEFRP
jgi:hypothetical protein